MMKPFLAVLAVIVLAFPALALAKSAEVLMSPTRLILDNGTHFGTVYVRNLGDAPGDYTINLADMKMQDNGAVVTYAKGEKAQYSALPFLHVAPSSMTLKPGEAQPIHVIMHATGAQIEDGEYRAHLQVHLVHPDADAAAAANGGSMVIRAEVVMSIPVIVRIGKGALSMRIEQPRLTKDTQGRPQLDFSLARDGNISSMGDLFVSCMQNGQPPRIIKKLPGQAVYRPLERRHFLVPLDETPPDINLSACGLKITYAAQKAAGGKPLAEAVVTP